MRILHTADWPLGQTLRAGPVSTNIGFSLTTYTVWSSVKRWLLCWLQEYDRWPWNARKMSKPIWNYSKSSPLSQAKSMLMNMLCQSPQPLAGVKFLRNLHDCFGGKDKELHEVQIIVGHQGAETVRTTEIRCGGVMVRKSEPTKIRRSWQMMIAVGWKKDSVGGTW